jgi:hypothetical protein
MADIIMTGPYITGQQPSSCGYYYPDMLRLRDEKREDGTEEEVIEVRKKALERFPTI